MVIRTSWACVLVALTATFVHADAGDIVDSFSADGDSPSGVGWDGSRLWVSYLRRAGSGEVDRLVAHDPATGLAVRTVPMPTGSIYHNLSFSPDGSVWADDLFRDVVRLAPTTMAEASSWRGPGWTYGATFVPGDDVLLLVDFMAGEIQRVDLDGRVISTVELTIDDAMLSGSAWDGARLWIVGGTSDMLYRVDTSTGAVVDSFASSAGASGIAWDGSCLWISDTRTRTLDRVDHGQSDLPPCMMLPDVGVPMDAGVDAAMDAGTEPDAGVTDPDAGIDAGVDPDVGVDAGVADPDAGVVDPDAGVVDPDAGVVRGPTRGGSGCAAGGRSGSGVLFVLIALALRRQNRKSAY